MVLGPPQTRAERNVSRMYSVTIFFFINLDSLIAFFYRPEGHTP